MGEAGKVLHAFLRAQSCIYCRREMIGLDIISEILETDRLAEEKLEQALQKRSEMLSTCQLEIDLIRLDAEEDANNYREKKLGVTDAADADKALKKAEEAQLKALADAYEKNHEAWEKEIVAAITG